MILENLGQPGPEAICTQAAALRYVISVHLKHLDQFEKAKKQSDAVMQRGCNFRQKINAKLPRVETLHWPKTPTDGS